MDLARKQYQKKYQDKLEKHPLTSFPIESFRRFNKIQGKHLAIVIALNLFVALSLLKTSSLMLEIMEVAERRATVLRPPGRRLPRLAG